METLGRDIAGIQKEVTVFRKQTLATCEQVMGDFAKVHSDRIEDLGDFHTHWDTLVNLLREHEQSYEDACCVNRKLVGKMQNVDIELRWYKEKCRSLELDIERCLYMVQEEVYRRQELQKHICEWSTTHETTKFKLFENFKHVQSAFQQLKTTTEREVNNQKSELKYLNFKIADAVQKYAANMDRERKELQCKLDTISEEKEQIEQQLKKAQDQLAEMKAKEADQKNEKLTPKDEILKERSPTQFEKGDDLSDGIDAKLLFKSNKTIRQIAKIISSRTSIPIGFPNQESTNHSSENSFHNAVIEAVEKTVYEKNCSAQYFESSMKDLETKVEQLSADLTRELKSKQSIESEVQLLKKSSEKSKLSSEQLSQEVNRLKKQLNKLTTENQIIQDKNKKLAVKEKRLESESAQLKFKLHDVIAEKDLLEKNNDSLTQEADILKKNLQLTEEKVEVQLDEISRLKSQSAVRDVTIFNYEHKAEKSDLFRNEETLKQKERIGCVDPQLPLDVQLLFYK